MWHRQENTEESVEDIVNDIFNIEARIKNENDLLQYRKEQLKDKIKEKTKIHKQQLNIKTTHIRFNNTTIKICGDSNKKFINAYDIGEVLGYAAHEFDMLELNRVHDEHKIYCKDLSNFSDSINNTICVSADEKDLIYISLECACEIINTSNKNILDTISKRRLVATLCAFSF